MKKLLIMLAAMLPLFAFVGCSDDENSNGEEKVGTYRVINNNEKFETELDDTLNGTMYEVIAFEYDENGDLISQKNIGDIPYGGGRSDIIEADETCAKVQISFLNLGEDSPFYDADYNERSYVAALTVIKPGENVDIVVDGETMISKTPNTKSSTKSTNNVSVSNTLDNVILNIQK